jgi:allantoinase
MALLDTLIRNAKVVHADGVLDAMVGVKDGKVAFLGSSGCGLSAETEIDGKGLYLMPGAITPISTSALSARSTTCRHSRKK